MEKAKSNGLPYLADRIRRLQQEYFNDEVMLEVNPQISEPRDHKMQEEEEATAYSVFH